MNKKIIVPGTELKMSPIGLGTLTAGIEWDGKEADAIFDAYLDMGGNVVDTARVYSDWIPSEIGRSERVVGDWIRHSGKRNRSHNHHFKWWFEAGPNKGRLLAA